MSPHQINFRDSERKHVGWSRSQENDCRIPRNQDKIRYSEVLPKEMVQSGDPNQMLEEIRVGTQVSNVLRLLEDLNVREGDPLPNTDVSKKHRRTANLYGYPHHRIKAIHEAAGCPSQPKEGAEERAYS